MSSVAVEHWGVSIVDLTWVVHDDDLSLEGTDFFGWIILDITGNTTSSDILDTNILDVESDVITWNGFLELFVMHFDGLANTGNVDWGEGDGHAWL